MPLFFAHSDKDLLQHQTLAHCDDAGAVTTFVGTVRKHNRNKDVLYLDYEAHESLSKKLFLEVEATAKKKFGLINSHAVHRLMRVELGKIAVIIQAQARHRHESFLGARYLIDELKKTLPIWRKEVYRDETFSFEQTNCHEHFDEAVIRKPVVRALLAMNIKHEELTKKHVLLVGAGGLGCPIAISLAALNVKLTIVDKDSVSLANLARQFAYTVNDIGVAKSTLLEKFISERFVGNRTVSITEFVDEARATLLAKDADLVIDATDDRTTKLMLKRLAYEHGFPLISASVHQQDGDVQVYQPGSLSCLLCFEQAGSVDPYSCTEIGVLTHVCQLIAAVAVSRALKILSGHLSKESTLTIIDPESGPTTIHIARDDYCQNCGSKKRLKLVKLARHHDFF